MKAMWIFSRCQMSNSYIRFIILSDHANLKLDILLDNIETLIKTVVLYKIKHQFIMICQGDLYSLKPDYAISN